MPERKGCFDLISGWLDRLAPSEDSLIETAITRAKNTEQFINAVGNSIRGIVEDLYPNVAGVEITLFNEKRTIQVRTQGNTIIWEDEVKRLKRVAQVDGQLAGAFGKLGGEEGVVKGTMKSKIDDIYSGKAQKESVAAVMIPIINEQIRTKEEELSNSEPQRRE